MAATALARGVEASKRPEGGTAPRAGAGPASAPATSEMSETLAEMKALLAGARPDAEVFRRGRRPGQPTVSVKTWRELDALRQQGDEYSIFQSPVGLVPGRGGVVAFVPTSQVGGPGPPSDTTPGPYADQDPARGFPDLGTGVGGFATRDLGSPPSALGAGSPDATRGLGRPLGVGAAVAAAFGPLVSLSLRSQSLHGSSAAAIREGQTRGRVRAEYKGGVRGSARSAEVEPQGAEPGGAGNSGGGGSGGGGGGGGGGGEDAPANPSEAPRASPVGGQAAGPGGITPPDAATTASKKGARPKAGAAGRGGRTYTSRFRGVHQTFPTRRWEAQFRRNGKPTSLGCFDEEVEAARAYDRMMLWIELHAAPGVKGGITNFDVHEYARDVQWLQTVSQDALVAALRTEGRKQAAARATRQRTASASGGGGGPKRGSRRTGGGGGGGGGGNGRGKSEAPAHLDLDGLTSLASPSADGSNEPSPSGSDPVPGSPALSPLEHSGSRPTARA